MTILLHEILPLELLESHLENGVIRCQTHPAFPELRIYNYTERAQFDRIWDAATNVCRGLVVADGRVVARGFNKFHNLNTEYAPETMEANLPKDAPPLVTEKLDGSMGVLFPYAGQWHVATRGSFASEQAAWATAWYRQHLPQQPPRWPAGVTPVFEIIYPENRIVVSYDFSGLVLLSIIDNRTGREFPRAEAEELARMNGVRLVRKFHKSLAECAAENASNEEGYVLTYSNGVKVKCKFENYVRLHRILTGLNPKSVWEMLLAGQDGAIAALLSDNKMPESFKTWLSGWATQLRSRYAEIEAEAKAIFSGRPGGTRKDDALYFMKTAKHLAGILFKMLDGKSYAESIFDMIRPKATDTFKVDGE